VGAGLAVAGAVTGQGSRVSLGGVRLGSGRRGYETATTSGAAANAALREAALQGRPAWQKAEEALNSRPYLAYCLGIAGLIPFVALSPLGAPFLPDPLPAEPRTVMALQNTYGGAILSFLGGVHWGGALARMEHPRMVVLEAVASGKWNGRPPVPPMPRLLGLQLACSVVPSLAAWPALVFPQEPVSSVGLAVGLLAMMGFDARVGRIHAPLGFPRWYHAGLRPLLTAVAVPALLLTAAYRGGEDLSAKREAWGDKESFTALVARAIGRAANGAEPPAPFGPARGADAAKGAHSVGKDRDEPTGSADAHAGAQRSPAEAKSKAEAEARARDKDEDEDEDENDAPRVAFDWAAVQRASPTQPPA